MSILVDLAELAPFVMVTLGAVGIWSGFIRFFTKRGESTSDKWARNTLFLVIGVLAWIPCWISYLSILLDDVNPNDWTVYVLLSLLGWAFIAHFFRDMPGSFVVGAFAFILLSAATITTIVVFDDVVINTDDLTVNFFDTTDIPFLVLIGIIIGIPILCTILYYFFIEAPVDFILTIFILVEGPIGILNVIQGVALFFWDNGLLHFLG